MNLPLYHASLVNYLGMCQGTSTGCHSLLVGTQWGHHGSIQTHSGGQLCQINGCV